MHFSICCSDSVFYLLSYMLFVGLAMIFPELFWVIERHFMPGF